VLIANELQMPPAIACPWINEDDWSRWVGADPRIGPTFEAWHTRSESHIVKLTALGMPVEKVAISFDEFTAWANGSKRPNDAAARSDYAALLLRSREQSH